MKYFLSMLIPLATLPFVSSCDKFAFASAQVVSKWKSDESGLGVVLEQKGGKWSGKLLMFDVDGGTNELLEQLEELGEFDEFAGGMFLAYGLHKKDTDTMLFPLATAMLTQVASPDKLIQSGRPYLEVDLKTEGTSIVGRWRTGTNPPTLSRNFERKDKKK